MSTVTPSVMSHMPLARWAAKADTRGATRRSMRACGRAGVDGRDGAFLAAGEGAERTAASPVGPEVIPNIT
eukprot:scaffold63683_cov39-Phaeocystis_antarctica.AAC.1